MPVISRKARSQSGGDWLLGTETLEVGHGAGAVQLSAAPASPHFPTVEGKAGQRPSSSGVRRVITVSLCEKHPGSG